MISAPTVQLRHIANGGYLFKIGKHDRADGWKLVSHPSFASHWPPDFLAEATERGYAVAFDRFEAVPSAACGCCGEIFFGAIRLVVDQPPIWRCDKHLGRNPCCIEGCGRTFAHSEGENYLGTVICGRHWREAPKYMRDRVARLRRKANKLGWPERLAKLHHQAFDLTVRAIREGRRFDVAEIEKMFGPV